MKTLKTVFWIVLFLQSALLYAQQGDSRYQLKLKSGTYVPQEKISPKAESRDKRIAAPSKEYVLIQFYNQPSAADLQQLKDLGIEFFNYIPDNAYWASIPSSVNRSILTSFNVRSVEPIQPAHKLDPALTADELPSFALKQAGKIDLLVTYFANVSYTSLISSLQAQGVEVLRTIEQYHQLEIRADVDKIEAIAAIDHVSYVAPIAPTPKGGDIYSRTNHRVNGLQTGLPGSLELKGEGVMVGIGDKGFVDPHPDLQNRVTNIQLTSLPDSWSSMDHADHVSGIVAGNGNISETAMGMAPKASLLTDHSTNIIYNAPQYVSNYGMVLTNNSYWFNANYGSYNSTSEYVDAQLLQHPSLLHVFIAGNPGSEYGKVEGFFGSAKNVLTVGSVTTTDDISGFSGRGPCQDGRLKPEIVSVGSNVYATIKNNTYQYASGTSMACPGVVGALTLIYDQYKRTHGVYPNAGLAKAIICNSADDIGNPGPDYTYGFGRVNVTRAITALNNNQYVQGVVNPGATVTH
ncbi:MAG TPA: S8 family serine peptidase, partial [Cytophagaceae bacterium]